MPKRKLTTTKPAKPAIAAKPVAPVAPVAAKPAVASKPAKPDAGPAKPAAHITRTAATVAAQRTNFGGLTDRDAAYLTFYGKLARANGGKLTVAAIAAAGPRNPHYPGSSKAHDAGVIVRFCKAGLCTTSPDGNELTFTKLATSHAAYNAAK